MRDEDILKIPLETIEKAVENSYYFSEVYEKLNIEAKNKKRRLYRYIVKQNMNYSHFYKTKEKTDNRWEKSNLIKCTQGSHSYKDVIEKLGLLPISSSYKTLKKYLTLYEIDFENKIISDKWKEVNISDIVKNSHSKKECLIKLGLRAAGNNFKQLDKYIKLYNLDISHFKYDNIGIKTNKIPLSKVLVKNSTYSRSHLKKRLYEEGLKEKKCEKCGQSEIWNGEKISLILDHKNGVNDDNRIENLRIVCPNCNATLATHCGKNKNKTLYDKEEDRYVSSIKYKLCECGNKILKNSANCNKCNAKKNRKVKNRPPYKQLLKDIEETNYTKTAKKYGVSDNAIRKWIKQYEENTV